MKDSFQSQAETMGGLGALGSGVRGKGEGGGRKAEGGGRVCDQQLVTDFRGLKSPVPGAWGRGRNRGRDSSS